eukprot:m.308503 g.308503  ORF g.308503 m.308503 type:complete len:296 (+) comp44133_c0_seq1:321-1208(+)
MDVREVFGSILTNSAVSIAYHPFHLSKTLMQVGYEPLAAYESKSFPFRHPVTRRPNAFRYIGHIRSVDGIFGLYRGLLPRLLEHAVGTLAGDYALSRIPLNRRDIDLNPRTCHLSEYALFKVKEGGRLCLARAVAVIASHPLYIISLRSIVQFVGRETLYSSIPSALSEIVHRDGFPGLFAGLWPRLATEMVSIMLIHALSSVITYLFGYFHAEEEEKEAQNDLKFQLRFLATYIARFVMFPYELSYTLLAVNDCGLQATQPPAMPIFNGFSDCWGYLVTEQAFKRGSNIFFRTL